MDKTCPNQCLERDRTSGGWGERHCLGVMSGARRRAAHCGKPTIPSSGRCSPLHPPGAPRGHVGPRPAEGRAVEAPEAGDYLRFTTDLRIARPPAPSQGRGGRRGAPRGAASSGGAHSGRETFGGSHFLARPGGGRGRCQMPGGRGKGGEAPAAIPPARRKTAI